MMGITVDCPNGHSLYVALSDLERMSSPEIRCRGFVTTKGGHEPCGWGIRVMDVHHKIDRGEQTCLMDKNHSQIEIGGE